MTYTEGAFHTQRIAQTRSATGIQTFINLGGTEAAIRGCENGARKSEVRFIFISHQPHADRADRSIGREAAKAICSNAKNSEASISPTRR
jgi:hypothetical protein